MKYLGLLVVRWVKALRCLLLILEVNRVLKRLNVVEVLRLSPGLLRLRNSLERLLRSQRSDLVNLSWLLSILSPDLLVVGLAMLTPILLGKVVLLKRLSLRGLVRSLHVLVEICLHLGICLLVNFCLLLADFSTGLLS